MALHERHRFVAEIGDFNGVAPEIAALVRVGAVRLERRLDGDFDPMRDSLVHETDILAPPAAASTVSVAVLRAARRANFPCSRMMGAGRLAEAKALMARLIAFDSVSDWSNLPLVDFVEAYLQLAWARVAPSAECGRRQGGDPRHDRPSG